MTSLYNLPTVLPSSCNLFSWEGDFSLILRYYLLLEALPSFPGSESCSSGPSPSIHIPSGAIATDSQALRNLKGHLGLCFQPQLAHLLGWQAHQPSAHLGQPQLLGGPALSCGSAPGHKEPVDEPSLGWSCQRCKGSIHTLPGFFFSS